MERRETTQKAVQSSREGDAGLSEAMAVRTTPPPKCPAGKSKGKFSSRASSLGTGSSGSAPLLLHSHPHRDRSAFASIFSSFLLLNGGSAPPPTKGQSFYVRSGCPAGFLQSTSLLQLSSLSSEPSPYKHICMAPTLRWPRLTPPSLQLTPYFPSPFHSTTSQTFLLKIQFSPHL